MTGVVYCRLFRLDGVNTLFSFIELLSVKLW
jgi:hypothetical protein